MDIETSPMEVLVWGLYKQRIAPDNVIKEWSCLSWAAKWLCESEIMSGVVSPQEAINREDKSIINGIWRLIDEASVIISHNGTRFDLRKLNVRFLINGLKPPHPYQQVDTYNHVKKYFAFSSYKLDYLNRILDLQRKIKTTYDLWIRCINGDNKALKEMEKYNRYDVTALEELYLKLRPWIRSHPNLGLYYDSIETVCPNCGSDNLMWGGYYYTPVGKYSAFRCKCGAIGRSRFTSISSDKQHKLVRTIAR
uniref:Putative RNase_H superfamily protein n=1 Tax=viral metagenome TaxID=1070528 RepID=A0A6M3XN35_9ZZZZ